MYDDQKQRSNLAEAYHNEVHCYNLCHIASDHNNRNMLVDIRLIHVTVLLLN